MDNEKSLHLVCVSPNRSLTWRQALVFYAGVCVGSLGIALTLALQGYWPVLPFAGLELAVLGLALWITMQRGRYRELIRIFPDRIVIDKGTPEDHRRVEFPLHWARVTLRPAGVSAYPSRLTISSHGRSCEIGRCLTENARRGLRTRLQQLIGRVDETPTDWTPGT